MTRLLLIRHGESEANKKDVFAGHLDFPLSLKGIEQAKLTAEYITRNYSVDAVYSSDLRRAFTTGKTIADRLKLTVETTEQLREIEAGKWDGMLFKEIQNVYGDDFRMWGTDIGRARCTGGESTAELEKRVMAELNAIADANPGRTVVVATHATVIRSVVASIRFDGDISKMNEVSWPTNASVTVVEKEEGRWRILSVSEDSHLGGLETALPKGV